MEEPGKNPSNRSRGTSGGKVMTRVHGKDVPADYAQLNSLSRIADVEAPQ